MAVTAGLVRLSTEALTRVPAESRPLLEPGSVQAGIVHIGLGAFHRAHQAVYTEEAMAASGDLSWGIVGVAPRSPGLISTIAAQDNLFSVTSLDGAGARTRVVGALAGVRHAPSDPAAIIDLLAHPAIRVVTLTVTEKAYHQDPATGRLRRDPEILADLTTDRPPATVPGLLARGLIARARADAGPIALVSCDNLPANGQRLRDLVLQALELVTAAGASNIPACGTTGWVLINVTFPGTTIDRIVPASTEDTLTRARDALGVVDLAAVAAEPYRQWVIEEDFPGGRPFWERAGAVMTADATPYEKLKLRGLNGVHSALAYLGALAGRETIADALALPHMRPILERMIAEDVAPSFTPPPGTSVVDYGQSALERFTNPAICHRTIQVAMDGTQKLPQRVLHGMLDRRGAGGEPRWAALVVAAWMRFARGSADDGRPLPLDDPLAPLIRSTLDKAGDSPASVVDALLSLSAVFPSELAADAVVRDLVLDWYTSLGKHGVRDTLAAADAP